MRRVELAGAIVLLVAGVSLALVGVVGRGSGAWGLGGTVVAGSATLVALLVRPYSATSTRQGGQLREGGDVELSASAGDLELIADAETGLLNAAFFAGLLPTKLATARRRLWPLSIVLMEGVPAEQEPEGAPSVMAAFAARVLETIRAADVACRVGERTVALVLDDTDEDGAAWVAERVQIQTARSADRRIAKVCCGVAAYPSHGIEAHELLVTAREALARSIAEANGPGLGPVIVAPTRPL